MAPLLGKKINLDSSLTKKTLKWEPTIPIEKMVIEASNSGAQFAKFQTWHEKNLIPGPWDHDGRREIYKKAESIQLNCS